MMRRLVLIFLLTLFDCSVFTVAQAIVGFVLVDTSDNTDIGPLIDGDIIYLGQQSGVNVRADIIMRQLTLLGSWTFSSIGQKDCAEFAARHRLPVERLFTHRFALEEAEAAYKLFDTQTTGKAVILPA